MTGLFVFVGGAAAFMMGLAISDGLDLEDRIISIVSAVILVPVSAVFGAGLFRSVFADALTRRRWRRMREQLHDLGFRDASEAQFQETRALQVPLLSNATLGPQRGGGIDHLVVGQIGGRHARCFNVRIRGGGWVDTPAVALRIPVSSPTTVVIPLDLKVPPQPRMRRVRFEHQRFDPARRRLLGRPVLRERPHRRSHDGVDHGGPPRCFDPARRSMGRHLQPRAAWRTAHRTCPPRNPHGVQRADPPRAPFPLSRPTIRLDVWPPGQVALAASDQP